MERIMRILVGLLSIVPMLFITALIVVIRAPNDVFGRFLHMSVFVVVPVTLALTVYFVYLVTRQANWPDSQRTMWILLLILWFPVTGPVYWFRHILNVSPRVTR